MQEWRRSGASLKLVTDIEKTTSNQWFEDSDIDENIKMAYLNQT